MKVGQLHVDEQTDMTKLIGAFHVANATKKKLKQAERSAFWTTED